MFQFSSYFLLQLFFNIIIYQLKLVLYVTLTNVYFAVDAGDGKGACWRPGGRGWVSSDADLQSCPSRASL